jgi:hypothetical protein
VEPCGDRERLGTAGVGSEARDAMTAVRMMSVGMSLPEAAR